MSNGRPFEGTSRPVTALDEHLLAAFGVLGRNKDGFHRNTMTVSSKLLLDDRQSIRLVGLDGDIRFPGAHNVCRNG